MTPRDLLAHRGSLRRTVGIGATQGIVYEDVGRDPVATVREQVASDCLDIRVLRV
jgi:hypothetical protein